MNSDGTKTLLLVEDQALIARSEAMTLKRHGYQVITVYTGEQAIDAVEKSPEIDLVLMDINLGRGLAGTQAAERILRQRDLPLIFLSSHAEREVVEKTEGITSYGYIIKNSGETVLIASIKMAFRLFEARLKEKEKAAALRESEERLRGLFGTMAEGVVLIAPQGEIIQANLAAEHILGLDRSEIEGRHYTSPEWETLRPDGTPMPPEEMAGPRVMKEKRPVKDVVMGIKHPDGSIAWINVSAAPLISEAGKFEGVVGTFADITERKRAEEALRESEANYRELAGSITDVFFAMDKDLCYTFWNRASENLTGIPAQDAMGKSLYDVFPDVRGTQVEETYLGALRTRQPQTFVNEYRLEGKHYAFEINAYPSATGLAVFVKDITERKRAEEALLESEKRFHSLFDNAAIGMYRTTLDGRILLSNPAGMHLLGYASFEEIANRNMEEAGFEPGYERSQFHERMKRDGSIVGLESAWKRKDGSIIYVRESATAVKDSDGNIICYDGAFEDITERKAAEERVQALLHEKELILKEVRHRIKNNMNTISSLLHLQLRAQKDPAVKIALQGAASRVHSMMVLYDKLYRTERFSALSIQEYIPPLLEEIVRLFPPQDSVRIETRIQDIVLAPQLISSLGIILSELATNALKYAFPGRRDGVLTVTAARQANRVSIIFEDNGIGLPESCTFENSTGFGLQLVGMLVQQIQGSISIERDKGTRFTIEFKTDRP